RTDRSLPFLQPVPFNAEMIVQFVLHQAGKLALLQADQMPMISCFHKYQWRLHQGLVPDNVQAVSFSQGWHRAGSTISKYFMEFVFIDQLHMAIKNLIERMTQNFIARWQDT